ncbi:MAG: hypothetical protein ACPF8V_11405 [Luteibaculum sp.]
MGQAYANITSDKEIITWIFWDKITVHISADIVQFPSEEKGLQKLFREILKQDSLRNPILKNYSLGEEILILRKSEIMEFEIVEIQGDKVLARKVEDRGWYQKFPLHKVYKKGNYPKDWDIPIAVGSKIDISWPYVLGEEGRKNVEGPAQVLGYSENKVLLRFLKEGYERYLELAKTEL